MVGIRLENRITQFDRLESMTWYLFSGPWNKERITRNIKHDAEKKARNIIVRKNRGIITGGAPGIDHYVERIVLEHGNIQKQLQIHLPNDFMNYIESLGHGSDQLPAEIKISRKQVEETTNQLIKIRKIAPHVIYEGYPNEELNKELYYERNSRMVLSSDFFIGFHVDDTDGTRDAIEKAIFYGIPVQVFRYEVKNTGWTREIYYLEFNTRKRGLESPKTKRILEKWYEQDSGKSQIHRYGYYEPKEFYSVVKTTDSLQ